jgi:hypothetical protein
MDNHIREGRAQIGPVSLALVALALGGLKFATAPAESPFEFDSAPGRLPENVVPLSYNIAITPDVQAQTFSGTESVRLRLREATATVIFNSLALKLSEVRLDGAPVRQVTTDDQAQLTSVTLPAASRRPSLCLTRARSSPERRVCRPSRMPEQMALPASCCP